MAAETQSCSRLSKVTHKQLFTLEAEESVFVRTNKNGHLPSFKMTMRTVSIEQLSFEC